MAKRVIYLVTALFVASCPLAYAQDAHQPKLTQADLKAITDARIGTLKAALQLTPEQQKNWPALEAAIRERAQTRDQRIAALAELRGKGGQIDPAELLQGHADALAKRSAAVKKLADAWQPLYRSLDADQKRRLRALAIRDVRELKDAFETRRSEREDEEDND
jgi:hypothetical protein